MPAKISFSGSPNLSRKVEINDYRIRSTIDLVREQAACGMIRTPT